MPSCNDRHQLSTHVYACTLFERGCAPIPTRPFLHEIIGAKSIDTKGLPIRRFELWQGLTSNLHLRWHLPSAPCRSSDIAIMDAPPTVMVTAITLKGLIFSPSPSVTCMGCYVAETLFGGWSSRATAFQPQIRRSHDLSRDCPFLDSLKLNTLLSASP